MAPAEEQASCSCQKAEHEGGRWAEQRGGGGPAGAGGGGVPSVAVAQAGAAQTREEDARRAAAARGPEPLREDEGRVRGRLQGMVPTEAGRSEDLGARGRGRASFAVARTPVGSGEDEKAVLGLPQRELSPSTPTPPTPPTPPHGSGLGGSRCRRSGGTARRGTTIACWCQDDAPRH